MSGDLINKEGSIKLQYRQGGYLDHGSYYAANSFQDPRSGRYILHGWIPEEDITAKHAQQKGWNGSLAIPREIFLLTIPAVVHALRSQLSDISCIETICRPDGSYDLHTLGMKPISEVDHFRSTCGRLFQTRSQVFVPRSTSEQRHWLYSTMSSTWELEATISLAPHCETVGFHVKHNHDLSVSTTITFSALAESITVDRASSNDANDINKCAESGPFTLFTTKQFTGVTCEGSELKQESLHIRIISDEDVLEVFANDRFALATMVYSKSQTGAHGGITAFATGESGSAVFESVSIWDGLNGEKSIVIDECDHPT
jgi:beta-fructofuranosidase